MKTSQIFIKSIILGLLASSCKKEVPKVETQAHNVVQVVATPVLSMQPQKPVVLPGELQPWNKVQMYSKVKGFVKEVRADRGSKVQAGQILAVLDAPEALAELEQARSQVLSSEASFQEARARCSATKLTYQRLLKASGTKGAIATHELDLAQAKMQADSAFVTSAQSNWAAAKSLYQSKSELVNYLTIRAPFTGTVTERNISPGALIGAADVGSKPLFVLEDTQTLRLTLAIPENYSGAIHPKSTVSFTVNSVLHKDFKAVFGRSAESIQEKNRSMMIEFDVDNRKGELKAGMYAEVQLSVKRSYPSLFVPKSAVVSSSENIFIIQEKEGKATWVHVKKGITLDSLVEVFGALEAGNLVVKEASEELREGQELQLKKLK